MSNSVPCDCAFVVISSKQSTIEQYCSVDTVFGMCLTFTSTLVIPCIAIITFVVWVQKQLRLNRIWKSVLLAKVLHHLPTNPAFSRRSLCQIVMTAFGPFRVVRLFRAVIVRMVMTKGSIFYHLR